jgi:hypothetical protein
LISIDVAFNEVEMIHPHKVLPKQNKNTSVVKEVEFEHSKDTSSDQEKDNVQDQDPVEEIDMQPLQNYQLARDRDRRQRRPALSYGYVDLVAFALNVADDIDTCEPQSYHEAITSNDSVKWILQ